MRVLRPALVLLFVGLLFDCGQSSAQVPAESSSKPSAEPTATQDPSLALRDILAAACSESARDFGSFFTPENETVFQRLAPVTRVALMKRFVLLDEPGVPRLLTNPSGRPLVRCETASITAEMQLGAAHVQENLAFVPLEARPLGDSAGVGARRVTIGLVREGGGWKLLSIGLLLLDLNALEQEWLQADLQDNEEDSVRALVRLAAAVEKYRELYSKFPESLAQLGPPDSGPASPRFSALVSSDLAGGSFGGYSFRYTPVAAKDSGAIIGFALAATPLIYGKTGRRSFLVDSFGGIHGADHKGALAETTDPRVDRSSDSTGRSRKD
ncbi:MAG: hypothetical protein ABSF92_11845 [Candidatus Acidiferrales bacterium]|jgi:hypothetical protein